MCAHSPDVAHVGDRKQPVGRIGYGDVLGDSTGNELFQLWRRLPTASRVGPAPDRPVRHKIADLPPVPDELGWGRPLTTLGARLATERRGFCRIAGVAGSSVGASSGGLQHRLDPVLEFTGNNRWMLALPGAVLVPDQAKVDWVGEDLMDLSPRQWVAALGASGAKQVVF